MKIQKRMLGLMGFSGQRSGFLSPEKESVMLKKMSVFFQYVAVAACFFWMLGCDAFPEMKMDKKGRPPAQDARDSKGG